MNILEFLKVLVFSIVEGFTEWLPISSYGHMRLLDGIIPMNASAEFLDVFQGALQLGAVLGVVVLYFHKLNPWSPSKTGNQKRASLKLWIKIIVASLPIVIVGLLTDKLVKTYLTSGYLVAAALMIYGVLFVIMEIWNKERQPVVGKPGQISYQMALCIGACQVLALVPGSSRTGVVILGALLLGCSRSVATEFSFFMGIPVMAGAGLLALTKLGRANLKGAEVFYLIVGMMTAFFVSVYSIKFLLGYIRKNDFSVFGLYRIVLGVAMLVYLGVSGLGV